MPKTHFVLVHGAYHQPQHWDPLVTLLHQSGHQTSTPRLPSVSATPIPDCLAADTIAVKTAVVDAIANGSDNVVPVFHSYGGIPGFEALATLTDEEKSKIPRVICISAFIVPKGDSLVSVQKPDSRNYVEINVRNFPISFPFHFTSVVTSNTSRVPSTTNQILTNILNRQGPTATVPTPIPIFYSDVPASAAEHAASLLLPHVLEAFFTPTQHDGCVDFPVTYVVCTKDEALTVSYQRSAVEVARSREGRKGGREGVEVVEMESGHSPFLSVPEETVEVILKAIGEIS
jgi:pimeloyl-ACP methyl ester carboxylesterase